MNRVNVESCTACIFPMNLKRKRVFETPNKKTKWCSKHLNGLRMRMSKQMKVGSIKQAISCDSDIEVNWVSRSIRLLLNSMMVCGMYFDDPRGEGINWKTRCLRKYALLMTVLLWVNVARMTTIFTKNETIGPSLFWKLSVIIWMSICASHHTIWYYACKSGKLHQVLRNLDTFENFSTKVKQAVKRAYLLSWFSIGINMVWILIAFVASIETFDIAISPLNSLFSLSKVEVYLAKGCYVVAHVLLCSVVQFSSSLPLCSGSDHSPTIRTIG